MAILRFVYLVNSKRMSTRTRNGILLFVGICILALGVRLPGLGSFMTVDEEAWMLRSGEFWHKLVRLGDPGGTYLTTHPGAPTMWLAGAGIFLQEARLGFHIDQSNLSHFRLVATLPIAVVTSLLVALIALWSKNFMPASGAIGVGVVLATTPYLSGMSQIAHLDALQALFMLTSFVAFCSYWSRKRLRWLAGAGVFAGLALATKMAVGAWLLPVFVAITVLQMRQGFRLRWRLLVRITGFTAGVTALALFAAWPALWEKTDLSGYIERDIGRVITQEHTALEVSREPIAPISFYGRTLLGRVPIHTQLFFIAACLLVVRATVRREAVTRSPLLWLVLYVIGFLVILTFVAKKADRYALPALSALSLIAGWLGAVAWERALRRFAVRWRKPSAALLVLLLTAIPLLLSPHASAYTTTFGPSVLPLPQQGWGQGLEEAADWLNDHPLASTLRVATWYPGVLRTYFVGETFSLSSRHDDRMSYVVTYRNMEGREQDDIASNVLDELVDRTPVHAIAIQGVPHVWIYQTDSLVLYDRNTGELIGDDIVGQSIPNSLTSLSAIDIGFATFSSRNNTQDVELRVVSEHDDEILRSAVVNARELADRSWHRFSFETLNLAEHSELRLEIASPTSQPGDAITVLFANADIAAGEMLSGASGGAAALEVRASADIAYRLIP